MVFYILVGIMSVLTLGWFGCFVFSDIDSDSPMP